MRGPMGALRALSAQRCMSSVAAKVPKPAVAGAASKQAPAKDASAPAVATEFTDEEVIHNRKTFLSPSLSLTPLAHPFCSGTGSRWIRSGTRTT